MTAPATAKRSKPTIDDQIAAVRQLIDAEANRIENRVSRGLMRPDTAQRRLDVLGAAYATIALVRRYRVPFRNLIEAERTFERERAAELEALNSADDAGREAA